MNFKSFASVALIMVSAVYTVLNGGYKYFNYAYRLTDMHNTVAVDALEKVDEALISENSGEGNAVNSETDSDSEKVNSTDSIAVSAVGTAQGSIVSEFFSPYSANTSYGKIYMKNSTGTDIDLEALFTEKCAFKIEKNSQPQVLIMHTHTTESYILHSSDYYTENDAARSLNETENMIAIGNIFEQKLNAAGISVLHDKTVHDYPSYSGSYTRSANTVKSDLSAYPSIKIVIDIHRDSVSRNSDKVKPVVEINGKKAAQVMLVMGSETGGVSNFPNWRENLKLAVKFQQKTEEMYPGLARAMMLNSGKYNQNLSVGSMLLEVGTDGNTLSEAEYGAELAADALVSLLSTLN